jgi:hypothetical protein
LTKRYLVLEKKGIFGSEADRLRFRVVSETEVLKKALAKVSQLDPSSSHLIVKMRTYEPLTDKEKALLCSEPVAILFNINGDSKGKIMLTEIKGISINEDQLKEELKHFLARYKRVDFGIALKVNQQLTLLFFRKGPTY